MDLRLNTNIYQQESSSLSQNPKKGTQKMRKYDTAVGLVLIASAAVFFFTLNMRGDIVGWAGVFVAFTFYCISFLTFALTGVSRKIIIIYSALSLATSCIFVYGLWHFLWLVIAIILIIRSVWTIRSHVHGSIKIRTMQSASAGITTFLLGVSLLAASHHHHTLSELKPSAIVEGIVQSQMKSLSLGVMFIGNINGAKKLEQEKLEKTTVDDFLQTILLSKNAGVPQLDNEGNTINKNIDSKKEDDSQSSSFLANAASTLGIDASIFDGELQGIEDQVTEASQSAITGQMRNALAQKLGIDVSGSESLFTVLSQVATLKVTETINQNPSIRRFLPILLSTLFFISIFSAASVLRFIWLILTSVTFWILKTYGFIKVIKVQKVIDALKY
jgi:hypothetical protein